MVNTNPDSLRILFWNVRSAMNKTSEILQYSSDNTANIALLSETWQINTLPGKYDTFSATIKEIASAENYLINCFSCPRQTGKRGGGVATLSETHLNVKRYSIHNNYVTFESPLHLALSNIITSIFTR